jgi:hypothetical protein
LEITEMGLYRKKPVVIDAWKLSVDRQEAPPWIGHAFKNDILRSEGDSLIIHTLEDGPNRVAKHVASPGDWIIRGIKGELYACKPDIFEATYEAVE